MKAENKEIIPSPEIHEYKIKEKIKVYDTVLKSLMKFSNNSSNGNIEGILFGHETDNSIVISHAFPLEKNHTQDDIINIISYLQESRLDYIKVGIFSCIEKKNLFTKSYLKNLIETQRLFPSTVVLNYFNNFYKSSNYSFECFRLDKHFMEKIDLIQVEEDDPNIFKKFTKFNDITQKLDFKIIDDVHSILGNMINKTSVDNMSLIVEENRDQKTKLFSVLNELNKNSEIFAEEQKKYIEYYKLKKTFGKNKENEFNDLLSKKGSELSKLEKIDISIISKNLSGLSDQINTLLVQSNMKNAFFTEAA